jgi:probable rRNA maturation factor
MAVYVSRKARGSAPLRSRQVRTIAERMLAFLGRDDQELSVLLTDDPFIQTLNAAHRGKDRPTDVLAFALNETVGDADAEEPPGTLDRLLGDVVISLDTAARQARERRHSLLAEVTFLLAHGILHLIGYDHQTDEQEATMDAMTAKLVSASAA